MEISAEIESADVDNETLPSLTNVGEPPKATNNRAGKKNYSAADNLQFLLLIEEKKKFNAGGKDPFWKTCFKDRSGDVAYSHFRDMTQAVKTARSNVGGSFPFNPDPLSATDSEFVAKVDQYYKDLLIEIKRDKAKYFANSWWDLDVVKKLCVMQMKDETQKCVGKVQDSSTVLNDIKQAYANKYEAEQQLRMERLSSIKKEEAERQKKNDILKQQLVNEVHDLVTVIREAASPAPSSSSQPFSLSTPPIANLEEKETIKERITSLENKVDLILHEIKSMLQKRSYEEFDTNN